MITMKTANWFALVGTALVLLAFLIMPVVNAPQYDAENDALATEVTSTDADGNDVETAIRENISALSISMGNTPELGYPMPIVSTLTIGVVFSVIAFGLSFVPQITRIARYLLLVGGIIVLVGYFAIPFQIQEVDSEFLAYSQMLGYGFWIGVLGSLLLIGQGFMGRESDPIIRNVSNVAKSVRVTRQQLLSGIVLVIGAAAVVNALSSLTGDITTVLNFSRGGFTDNTDPIALTVPTQGFIVGTGIYFVLVGLLGLWNNKATNRLVNYLLIVAGMLFFLMLLVASAAGGQTNATTMITESLRTATPIAIGAMAGIWCERSGVINIAIEGMMLFGACIGFTTLFLLQVWFPAPSQSMTFLYMFLGVCAAVLSGGLASLLHAWLSITFSTDQIVSGTVINILALGTTSYIRAEVLLSSEAGLSRLPAIEIPLLADLPVIGPLFNSQPIFYLMFVVIIVTHIVLFNTRWGLRTIAVGENPHAADTLGIKVNRMRWINVFISGMIAGLAGAWFSLEATGRFTDGMTDGKGFISLAAMIFGKWTPSGSFGGSLLFGFSEALGFRFQILNVALPPQFLQMVPYIVTLIVLAGLVGRAIPPKAIGQPYKTEGSR
ncbi:MAG: ABC transporter permease [Chloroflexota bacterium]